MSEEFKEACQKSDLKKVAQLLSSIDMKAINQEMSHACENGNIALVEYFVSSPLGNHIKDYKMYENQNFIVLAVNHNKLEVVKFLLENNYEAPDSIGPRGLNLMEVACGRNHLETFKYLTTRAEPNWSELFKRACRFDSFEVMTHIYSQQHFDIKVIADLVLICNVECGSFLITNTHGIENYLKGVTLERELQELVNIKIEKNTLSSLKLTKSTKVNKI